MLLLVISALAMVESTESYVPQTCIANPWIPFDDLTGEENAGHFIYPFLDTFNGIRYKTCMGLEACRCQMKRNGEFHTNCDSLNASYPTFSRVPKDKIYLGTTHLTFKFHDVKILQNDSFSTLQDLVFLDLSYNNIEQISSHAFRNLKKLRILLLNNNFLTAKHPTDTVYPVDVFKPISKALKILDISYNIGDDESILPYEALSLLTELEEIVFNLPANRQLESGFSKMIKLKVINCMGGQSNLPDNFFENVTNLEIETVCMVQNSLRMCGQSFANLHHVKMLDLSDNSNLFSGSNYNFTSFFLTLPSTLTHLYLNKTGILGEFSFHKKGAPIQFNNLEVLTMDDNSIQSMDVDSPGSRLKHLSLRLNEMRNAGDIDTFFLLGIFNMRDLLSVDVSFQAQSSKPDRYRCSPQIALFSIYLINSINCSCDYGSKYFCDISLPPNLRLLQLASNPSISMQLVGNLTWMSNSSLSTVNLSNTNTHFLGYPIMCEVNVVIQIQTIDLSFNSMECIHSKYFNMCNWTNLKHLFLSHNNFGIYTLRCRDEQHAPLAFLKPLTEIEFLDLGHNNLVTFDLAMDISGGCLEILDISQNMLSSLSKDSTSRLDEANSWRLKNNLSAISIDLSGNQLVCACDNTDFYLWLYNTRIHFKNNDNYKCRYAAEEFNLSSENLSKVLENFNTICHLFQDVWMPIIVTVVTYIFITAGAILYRLRHTIQYLWIKMRMNRHKIQAILNPNHQYHGFISCDRAGAIWTKRNLLPMLEPKGTPSFLSLYF